MKTELKEELLNAILKHICTEGWDDEEDRKPLRLAIEPLVSAIQLDAFKAGMTMSADLVEYTILMIRKDESAKDYSARLRQAIALTVVSKRDSLTELP